MEMRQIEKKAYELVEELNDTAYESGKLLNLGFYPYELMSNGEIACIKFLGIIIWDSDNDDRDCVNEDKEIYEDLKTHILKISKKIMSELDKVYNF